MKLIMNIIPLVATVAFVLFNSLSSVISK